MSFRSDRDRRHRIKTGQATVVTAILALLFILGLGGALWATSTDGSGDPESPIVTVPAPPAPRPVTAEPLASASHVPAQGEGEQRQATLTTGSDKGQLAPDFTLDGLDGEATLSHWRGQVVLVNFWASWCAPCRVEFPHLQAIYEKYKDQGFTILAVNLGETAATAAAYADQLGLDFPILMDTNAGVARQYALYSIPTSYFLDRQGVVRETWVGAMRESFVEDTVSKLLEE